jgi:hypothetical protein
MAYLLPPLLLLLVLVARRYPGERALIARMDRPGRRDRQRPVRALACSSRPIPVPPRGGRLIGASLAVRPPPARLAVLQS